MQGGHHWTLGVVLLLQQKPDLAIESFRAHEAFRDYAKLGRAMALHDLGRADESAQLIAEVEASWGDDAALELARQRRLPMSIPDPTDLLDFTARVVLVTGASGIAAAGARLFAASGAPVFIVSRTAEKCANLADEITESGGEATWAQADLTSESEADAATREIPVIFITSLSEAAVCSVGGPCRQIIVPGPRRGKAARAEQASLPDDDAAGTALAGWQLGAFSSADDLERYEEALCIADASRAQALSRSSASRPFAASETV